MPGRNTELGGSAAASPEGFQFAPPARAAEVPPVCVADPDGWGCDDVEGSDGGEAPLCNLARVHGAALTPRAFYEDFAIPGRPVLVKGGCSGLGLADAWARSRGRARR